MRIIVRKRILKKYNNKCVYCKSTKRLEVDHIIPLSRGGKENEDNMQILCKICNLKKGSSVNIDQYFSVGDGKNYIYISNNFPLSSFSDKEFKYIFEQKIKELCHKYYEN